MTISTDLESRFTDRCISLEGHLSDISKNTSLMTWF